MNQTDECAEGRGGEMEYTYKETAGERYRVAKMHNIPETAGFFPQKSH